MRSPSRTPSRTPSPKRRKFKLARPPLAGPPQPPQSLIEEVPVPKPVLVERPRFEPRPPQFAPLRAILVPEPVFKPPAKTRPMGAQLPGLIQPGAILVPAPVPKPPGLIERPKFEPRPPQKAPPAATLVRRIEELRAETARPPQTAPPAAILVRRIAELRAENAAVAAAASAVGGGGLRTPPLPPAPRRPRPPPPPPH